MKLILGGYANGRTAYAMQNYQLTESDCFDAAAEPLARWNGQRLILHAEQLVNPWLEQGKEPCTEILPWLERWQNAVLITQEVGCGLVPVTPQQRQLREPTLSLIFPPLMKRQARRSFAANSCVCSPHGPCAHTFMHLRAKVSRQRIWFSPDTCSRPPAGASRRNPFGRPA